MTQIPDAKSAHVKGFWTWLFVRDSEGDRGVDNLLDRWNGLGILLSAVLSYYSQQPAEQLALNVAMPGAAALVGLSFAWAGRSASLLQDKEFSEFIIEKGPPVEGYVYSFQLAVLVVAVFITVSLSLIAGGLQVTTGSATLDEFFNRSLLFYAAILAARECWGVIYFANKLSIQFLQVRRSKLEKEK